MRTIIAGSRDCTDMKILRDAISSCGFPITTVISGGARGVDRMGELWAREHGIPVELFPADWDSFGKSDGYLRNEEMAKNAQALIAVWDGISKGTGNMIDLGHKHRLVVHVHPSSPNLSSDLLEVPSTSVSVHDL